MQEAAKTRGIDLSQLRARQFTVADFEDFDLIVAMDRQNQRDIERLRPASSQTKVQLFMDQDVPDPYYTRDFDRALDIIQQGAVSLLAHISQTRDP
jgi:protein-tyrosine phosphatase